ncbi:zinc transporter ZIP12-like [Amphiura filiformis]|uniref:zinc transporter ZIP12-like n=1 Tax=Amphiura filiformis TaxID=82378 RepID=UPI003B227B65
MQGFEDPYSPKAFTAGNSFEVIDDANDIPEFNDFDNLEKYSVPPPPPPDEKPKTQDTNEIKVDAENDIKVDAENDMTICTVQKSSNNAKSPSSGPYMTDTLEGRILEESKRAMMHDSTSTTFSFLRGMQSTSVLVLISDAIHNLADGIAIGVGFTLDGYVGSSITIAVFCHELPHEIGDFSVLLKHGMSFRTAFFWSIVSNIFGFLGLYIGIALGSNQALHQWIFAGTAGLFLYISLVDLMPEITHDPNGFNCPACFMHNVGLILGWTLMMVLAYFEETMKLQ